jgi:hypothetical protein
MTANLPHDDTRPRKRRVSTVLAVAVSAGIFWIMAWFGDVYEKIDAPDNAANFANAVGAAETPALGPATSSVEEASPTTGSQTHRVVLAFNDAWNDCHLPGGSNREKLLAFFTEDATYLDPDGHTWTGRSSIGQQLCRGTGDLPIVDSVMESRVDGDLVTLQLERRINHKLDSSPDQDGVSIASVVEVKPHTQVLVLRDGLIARLISVLPPDTV